MSTTLAPPAGKEALAAARAHETGIVKFLRDIIAIRGESGKEEARCRRVGEEYEKLGFPRVWFGGLGSVVARIGNGPLRILMDGHIDTVGVGDPAAWTHDPFEGKLEDGKVWGRGAVDELPAIACMAYGAKLMMERGVPDDVTVYLCASVMEEDCDGLPLLHLIEREGLRADVAILGEPTNLDVYRGHRGRMEMTITTKGVSAHGAHAERGVNAVYKMGPVLREVEELNLRLATDPFLGKGSIIVSFVSCKSPSLCAVPDECTVNLDRRLTAGETVDSALDEVRSLPSVKASGAVVTLLTYDAEGWNGARATQEKYFPTWVLPEEHALVQGTARAVEAVRGKRPAISRWHFSTNGVATMGRLGIPTVGFAPGLEELSHSTGEWVAVDDLVKATAVYSLIPAALAEQKDLLVRSR
jgi:putative selenium metabolism hydrolase